jgi:hypothetical protein
VERWASGWLGDAWVNAPLGVRREPVSMLCLEVAGRASTKPSPAGYAAVAALRRVAPESEHTLLDETIEILSQSQPAPSWLASPLFEPVRAWRAADVWDSERVLFVDFTSTDPNAAGHTLMAQILDVAGTLVDRIGVLRIGAAEAWERMTCRCRWLRSRSTRRWPTWPTRSGTTT